MGQATNLQATAIEFIQAAEAMLLAGDFSQAESTARACLKLLPGDKRALALLARINRKDAKDAQLEIPDTLTSITSQVSGPFTPGSGARHGRFLPHEMPDDGKEQAIASARRYEASENWAEAEKAWLEVLSVDASDTWAWTQYAHLLSVNLGDYGKAEEAYRKALEADPTDDWAWGKLGIMLADFSGKIEQGQEMLRRAIELDPREAYYKGWLGWSLYNQSEEMEEAEELLQEAVSLMPSYQWAWFHLGYLLSTKEGRHRDSRTAYQKSIKLSPSDTASHFNLGVLYQEVFNQPKQALKCFQKVVALKDDDAASWRRIAFLQRDHYLDPHAAIKAFTKVTALDEDDYEAFALLGQMLWEEEKDMAGGLDAINHALRVKEDSPWIWCHLGDYYCFGERDIGSAEVAYRRAIELNDSFDWALAHLGSLLLDHKNEAEEAELLLSRAIEVSPDYMFALRELINCKQALARPHTEIITLFEKVLETEPDAIEIIIEYADLLANEMGRPEEGFERLKAALSEAPDHFYLQWSLLHYCRYDLGRLHDAAPVIPELELIGEDEMSIACLIGRYYCEAEGDLERAEVWLRRAVDIAPDDHFAVHELGSFLLYFKKDFAAACEVLAQAALLDKDGCHELGGDIAVARILSEPDKIEQEEGVEWLNNMLGMKKPALEAIYASLMLLIVYDRWDDALALSGRMISLYPAAAVSWLLRLACLQATKSPEAEIAIARDKAKAYKANWLDLDQEVANIINPLG